MRFTPHPDCQIKNIAQIYEQYLSDKGRFVEVGAFDGATYSNTVFLAETGWEGIYIEAHPDFAKQCQLNHQDKPNVKTIPIGVSDHEGFMWLYEIGECSTFVWDKTAKDWGGDENRKIRVPVQTLAQILLDYDVEPEFDLLVLDVEHHEMKVLSKFDIKYWNPKMCIVETHEGQSDPMINFMAPAINEYFMNNGYKKIHFDNINSIFVR